MNPKDDPILVKFRAALDKAFGDRIERVILYGSRARGDARPDSDYDVVVFLRGFTNRVDEKRPLGEIEVDLMQETGELVVASPYPEGAWRARTPFMHEVRKDGIDLSSRGRPSPVSPSKTVPHAIDARDLPGLDCDCVMKPETTVYLNRARQDLPIAEHNLGFPAQAARYAYSAAFHAAQALIFELLNRCVKTHKGVRTTFSELVKDDADSREHTTFLADAYDFKTIADYDISGRTVSREQAIDAIARATRFVEYVTALLAPPPAT